MPRLWFDAHLDLAYLAVNGRDMLAPLDRGRGPHPPGALTLPALEGGYVRLALVTVFTEADGKGPEGYPAGDAERAHRAGRAQLEAYHTWRDRGALLLDFRSVFRPDPGVGRIRAGMGVAEVEPPALEERLGGQKGRRPLHAGVLVECADPVRRPEELEWWIERGVVAIGLAWAKGGRYASGNSEPSASSGVGLTDLGRAMVARMDELGVTHDVSHLSDRALDELLALTTRPVIASHSNSRVLMGDGNQRHLTDEAAREIARRGGVIGLNLFSAFLRPGLTPQKPGRATVDEALDHVEHLCGVAGHRRHLGLGSDMDGGFAASLLPEGIDAPMDLGKLSDGLARRGWSDAEIEGFAWRNWADFWSRAIR